MTNHKDALRGVYSLTDALVTELWSVAQRREYATPGERKRAMRMAIDHILSEHGGGGEADPERVAQLIAHRACGGEEHDPANGKLHGCCVVCLVPWPCAYAGTPPTPSAPVVDDAMVERAAKAIRDISNKAAISGIACTAFAQVALEAALSGVSAPVDVRVAQDAAIAKVAAEMDAEACAPVGVEGLRAQGRDWNHNNAVATEVLKHGGWDAPTSHQFYGMVIRAHYRLLREAALTPPAAASDEGEQA